MNKLIAFQDQDFCEEIELAIFGTNLDYCSVDIGCRKAFVALVETF